MTILAIFGMLCLGGIAAFVTFVAVVTWISELGLSGQGAFGPVFAAAALGLWTLAWWINPFSISVSIT